ncbi:hypothetical protein AVEN_51146-1 [Araneus ventricosus]|uniref:Uncharacterized protein n=1 Tax=Araneus ventricosus TaxID=182803 RepID=A0A4Y2IAN2_ARAVE|nr:hypothetical protein AVEN_51146-1 [Araneus ventricosus]
MNIQVKDSFLPWAELCCVCTSWARHPYALVSTVCRLVETSLEYASKKLYLEMDLIVALSGREHFRWLEKPKKPYKSIFPCHGIISFAPEPSYGK